VKPLPRVNKFIAQPKVFAKAAVVMDEESGTIIFSKNPDLRLHPASITKIATAAVALNLYPAEEIITVKNAYPIGKNMELIAGEVITVGNLVYGLLVHSANDAAYVLAGQSENEVKKFILEMNNFVEQLNLRNTHFANFDGEDDENHYSSAWDLAYLAKKALENKTFSEAVRINEITIKSVDEKTEHKLVSTNELLGVITEVRGVKTGWTPESGESFVGLLDLNGHQVITVVLNSSDRFGDTKRIIAWLKEAVLWGD